jgi:hypothetical protein
MAHHMGNNCAGVAPVYSERSRVGGAGRLADPASTSGLLSGEAASQAVPTSGQGGRVGELLAQAGADVADCHGEEPGVVGIVGSQREGGVGSRLGSLALVDLGIAGGRQE